MVIKNSVNVKKTVIITIISIISIVAIVFFAIYIIFQPTLQSKKIKEGFNGGGAIYTNYTATKWSQNTINKFLKFQETYNPNFIFDLDILQEQATEKEVEMLLQNGKWTWDIETEALYLENLDRLQIESRGYNSNIKSIYNQNAILELLSYNTPEGKFLLNGKEIDDKTTAICSNGVMKRVEFKGYDGILGNKLYDITDLTDYSLIPAFKTSSDCNPCDKTCPFTVDDKDNTNIWKKLWGLTRNIDTSVNYSLHKYGLDGNYVDELQVSRFDGINRNL
jgi:hypothetical protein